MREVALVAALRRSIVVWPITAVYCTGVALILLIVHESLSATVAIIIFAFGTLLITLISVYGELLEVHRIVTSQNGALLARVEQLLDEMHEDGGT